MLPKMGRVCKRTHRNFQRKEKKAHEALQKSNEDINKLGLVPVSL